MSRIVLMAIAVILAASSVVSADCAWVLWSKEVTVKTGVKWEPFMGLPTYDDCKLKKDEVVQRYKNAGTVTNERLGQLEKEIAAMKDRRTRNELEHQRKVLKELLDISTSRSFECFSDGIDPRKPK